MLVTRMQWRYQREDRWYEIRRETYVEFLTALNKSYETLWALSLGEYQSELPQVGAAREILRSNGVYETRQRVLITAPQPVIDACEEAFRRLKDVRDVVGIGEDTDSADFKKIDDLFRRAIRELDTTIRTDLTIHDPEISAVTFARPAPALTHDKETPGSTQQERKETATD